MLKTFAHCNCERFPKILLPFPQGKHRKFHLKLKLCTRSELKSRKRETNGDEEEFNGTKGQTKCKTKSIDALGDSTCCS